jgi:hypothetical protein
MSLASALITSLNSRLDMTIGASTTPSQTNVLAWIDEAVKWIVGVLAEQNSDLGRELGTIKTIKKTITAITTASPPVVTSASHGLSDGEEILIKDVVGMTDVNDIWFIIDDKADDTLELQDLTATDIVGAAYDDYTSGGYIYKKEYTDLASYIYAPAKTAWIHDTYERKAINLCTEEDLLQYDPSHVGEPEKFYVDGDNNIHFIPTPDDAYIVRIPYWKIQTAVTATSSTVPFNGIFDGLIIEAVEMRAKVREEVDPAENQSWMKFLSARVKNVIWLRKHGAEN